MASSDAKLQELHDALEQIFVRLSRVEESMVSSHECFSPLYFNEMMRTLSMPGLRFIGGRFQHRIHTYWWLLTHVVALLVSYVYIKEEYDNWQSSPVIRTQSNNMSFVHEIPFPAVTVCVPYSINSGYDFLGNLHKCTSCNSTKEGTDYCFYNIKCDKEEIETLAVASFICEFQGVKNVSKFPPNGFTHDVNISIDNEMFSIYAKTVFPPCDFLIKQMKNQNNEFISGCNKNGFQHFLAYGVYGVCTTVNGLRHEDIYKENVVLPIPIQPTSVDQRYIGKHFTLENMIYLNGTSDTVPVYHTEDDYFTYHISKRQNQNYLNVCNIFAHDEVASVIIHNPAEIPLFQDVEHIIKTDEYNYMKVMPKLVTTKKDLIRYSPIQRSCLYSYERELMLFKYYTESGCEAECWVNCSLQTCNCVPHYLPRPNISLRVCTSECKASCDCGCLPDCVSLSYEFEASKETKDTNGSGVLYIYYKSKGFYPMIRVGINDLADFMAYSFGILGTFNGFSVMVVFELFYFITVRLWSSIYSYLKQSTEYKK